MSKNRSIKHIIKADEMMNKKIKESAKEMAAAGVGLMHISWHQASLYLTFGRAGPANSINFDYGCSSASDPNVTIFVGPLYSRFPRFLFNICHPIQFNSFHFLYLILLLLANLISCWKSIN